MYVYDNSGYYSCGDWWDNEKIVKKLKLELNRANIDSSTTSNRNGSATLTTNPGRMQTEAQAITVINSLIKRNKLSKGQFKIVVDKETDEEE